MMASSTFKPLFSPRSVPVNFKKMFSVPMASRPSQLKSVADDTVGMPGVAGEISVHYEDIQVPIRIVAGAEDKIVPCDQSRKLHHALPNSTLDVLPEVGHMSDHADPAPVIRLIDELSNPARPMPDVASAKTRAVGLARTKQHVRIVLSPQPSLANALLVAASSPRTVRFLVTGLTESMLLDGSKRYDASRTMPYLDSVRYSSKKIIFETSVDIGTLGKRPSFSSANKKGKSSSEKDFNRNCCRSTCCVSSRYR